MRNNRLKEVYKTIDFGTVEEKINNLPDFPKIIEFELTNHCNYRCIMCYTGLGDGYKPRGYMSEEVFERFLDEIRGKRIAVKFVGGGEPLLHPHALSYIRAVKEAGAIVHITTNASLLNDDNMKEIIDIGVDSVKFSFQGVDEEGYRIMRRSNAYYERLETIKRFAELRGDAQAPYLTIGTSIVWESEQQIADFRSRMEPLVDSVEAGYTNLLCIDADLIEDEEKRRICLECLESQEKWTKRYVCCPQIFDSLSIAYNGDVSSCCGDAYREMLLGNIMDSTIQELWMCPQEQQYREILSKGGYDQISKCKRCYDTYGWTYGTN